MRLMVACVCVAMVSWTALGAGKKAPKKDATVKQAAIALYDTVTSADLGDAVASFGTQGSWTKIAEGKEAVAFKGDAVLVNRKIAAVFKKSGAIEVYAKGNDSWTRRGSLAAVVVMDKVSLTGVTSVAVDGTAASVKGSLGKGIEMVFSLKSGSPVLKTTPVGKVSALRFEVPCRFGVLPDFFSDDLLVDATQVVVKRTEIPSDNFFLHMVGKGDCIFGAVWEKNVRDLELSLSGEGAERLIVATDVFYGKDGSIFAAVLEEKGIWHFADIKKEGSDKDLPITDWHIPYMAKWKANFTQDNGTVISKPLVSNSGARDFAGVPYLFHNHKLERRRGTKPYKYLTTLQKGRKGYLGPMVAYPIGRYQTPLDRFCIDDLLRECLGMQACAYVLEVEARSPERRGIFTCSYGKTPGMFIPPGPSFDYYRRAGATWKDDRAFMKNEVHAVMSFITFIQDRINNYVDLRSGLLEYLAEAEKKHPDQKAFIDKLKTEMAKSTKVFRKMVKPDVKANGKQVFTPWMKEMLKSLKVETPSQSAKGATAGKAPHIGDPQDARLAGLRNQVKTWRSMATMEMARNPAVAPIAKEIRKRTEAALRNPSNYERPTKW